MADWKKGMLVVGAYVGLSFLVTAMAMLPEIQKALGIEIIHIHPHC